MYCIDSGGGASDTSIDSFGLMFIEETTSSLTRNVPGETVLSVTSRIAIVFLFPFEMTSLSRACAPMLSASCLLRTTIPLPPASKLIGFAFNFIGIPVQFILRLNINQSVQAVQRLWEEI